jgi:hypothetical protein
MRRVLFWVVGLALVASSVRVSSAFPAQAAGQPLNEYQVKAAFLFNFAKFVEWPAGALAPGPAPIAIGIVGQDPFGSMIEDVTRSERVNGREIVVRRLDAGDDLRSQHILFISESERHRWTEIFASLEGASVLTVGDVEGFTQAGGVIRLTNDDRRIALEISLGAADRAFLKISSRLLSLARIVEFGVEERSLR